MTSDVTQHGALLKGPIFREISEITRMRRQWIPGLSSPGKWRGFEGTIMGSYLDCTKCALLSTHVRRLYGPKPGEL